MFVQAAEVQVFCCQDYLQNLDLTSTKLEVKYSMDK